MGNDDRMELIRNTILIELILNHRGERNAVHSRELERRFDISGRRIREQIRILRMCEGQPICSSCRGYFYPETAAEIVDTIIRLRVSALSLSDLCRSITLGGLCTAKINVYGGEDHEQMHF